MAKRQKTGGRRRGTPNKTTGEIKAALQLHGEELIDALLALTRSDDERVRLGAITAALDRGWGKPAQALQIKGDPDSPVIFNLRLGDGITPKAIVHEPEPAVAPALAAISAPDDPE
jgi:hypothetical protein